jgi:proteic killer suppression protein
MIVSFGVNGTEDIFNGVDTRAARRTCPKTAWAVARRKLDQLDSVVSLDDLRIPPGNKLEALRGDRKGQYSIRINDQWRLTFKWGESRPDDVLIEDPH